MEDRTSIHTVMKAFGVAALASLLGLGIVLALAALVGPAKAHSWYPRECCSGYDCAPISDMLRLPDGSLVITNTNGDQTVFPPGFRIRIPEDDGRHACIAPFTKRPICLFLPAEG